MRDYYSGQTDTVQNGQITLQPADSHGLLLLERAETHASAPFNWRNATVYLCLRIAFAMAIQPMTTAMVAIRMVCKRLALSTAAIYAG